MVAVFTGLGSGFVRSSASSLGSAGLLGFGALGRGGESVSVNAATGNLIVSKQDEFLAGRGLGAAVARTYNSTGDTGDRDNGDNWQQSTTRRVFDFVSGSSVKLLGGDGSVVTYSWGTRDGIAAYWATDGDGAHDRLAQSGSNWTWTDGSSQTRETYGVSAGNASEWRLISSQDNDGNTVTFSYLAGTDKLDRITTANGEWLSYVWSGNTITKIETGYTDLATSTAKTLSRTWYDYAGGRLSQVRVDLTPEDNASPTAAQSYWTQYTYDANGRLSRVLQKDGSQVDIAYDGSGRVSTLTQTVASGDTRITSLAYAAGYTTMTGPDGQVTRLDYDASKRLTKVTAPPAYAGAVAQVVQFSYDADGNLASTTDAAGKVTSFLYDADGNATRMTDANGNTIERWFDAGNRVTMERTYGSNAASSSDAQYTRFAYDSEGHLRYLVTAEGRVTEYRYTAAGQLQYRIDYPEHGFAIGSTGITEAGMDAWRNAIADRQSTKISLYSYDVRGNQTSVLSYGYATAAGAASTAEGYSRVFTSFDQAGRLLNRYAEGEAAESFIYDGMGRLTATTDVHGGTSTFVFDDAALTTTVTTSAGYTRVQTFNRAGELVSSLGSGSFDASGTSYAAYDKNGRVRVSTDETGNKTYSIYDNAGQLVGSANHFGHLTEYRRDAAGRVIAEIRYTNAISPANLTALGNPNNGLQMSALRPAAHSYDLWSWTVYDSAGRVVQAIDGDGGVTAFEYDNSDRVVKTTSYFTKVAVAGLKATPPTTPVAVTTHVNDTFSRNFYNRSGQLVGVLDGEGYLSEIVYDQAGQKVEGIAYAVATAAADRAAGTLNQLRTATLTSNAGNRRTRYVYDGQGLLRYAVDGRGQVTGFDYNVAGKATSSIAYAATISVSDFTYDSVKAAVAAIANDANDRESYKIYDARGRIAYTVSGSGAVVGFAYDSAGQVIRSVQYAAVRSTPTLPALSTMDSWAAGQAGNAANRVSRSYYTASGLLRFAVDAEGYVTRYDYDAADRNTRIVSWDSKISVNDATTISQVNSLATGAWSDLRMEYDQQGRLSSTYDALGTRTYQSYYGNGLLADVYEAFGTADQTRAISVYDGAGRLTTQYSAYGEAEQIAVSYTYDGLGNQLTKTDARGKVTTYAYNEVGEVISVTDALGYTATSQYNAFGEVTQIVDGRGGVTTNTYNSVGQLTRSTDALGLHTDYTYTAFGEIATVSRAGSTTSYQYDKLGRVTRVTDALGFYEAYTYDAYGSRLTSRNKLGGTTTYSYDRRGQMVAETLPMASYNSAGGLVSSTVTNTYTYDARGNMLTMVEASGLAEQRSTSFAYDLNGRVIQMTGQSFLGLTPITTYAYDARGNRTRVTDPAGARTIYYFDDLGRVTGAIDAAGTYTTTSYDQNGNVIGARVYAAAVAVPADGGSQEEAPGAPGGGYRETTFTYDALGRMTKSAVAAGVQTGTFNGTWWAATNTAIEALYEYDANGNVVKATDANGNVTWSYYDLLGRRTAQVDGEGYRTDWTYNADGNVLSERRYWNKAATPTSTTTPPAVTAHGTLDRITSFTYDLNGNRLSEARSGVEVHNGAGGVSTVTATVSYLYNGLGQVTRKTEASGDQVNYTYDAAGRLTVEARQAFVDQSGATVTPTVDYYYNGVGDLSRTRQHGNANAAERVTTYGYDGGKLRWVINAEAQDGDLTDGLTTYYWYDIAGRQTYEYYTRYNSAGAATASYDGVLTAYDAVGRVSQKWQAIWNGSTWIDQGPRTVTTYSAFGEVASVAVGGVTQQTNKYDDAGRLWATSAGDGVWKFFGYDKNGNQTIAIASAGEAFGAATTFQYAYDRIGQTNVNATYTQYDKRGMATAVTEEGRQLSVGGAAQTLLTTRGYNAFGEVASETNALGATIDYTYNAMGRLIRSESPAVQITLENGTVTTVRPTEHYYYDASGRLVASRDANGNLTRMTLLAGSGHGGSQALVTSEIHADGGIKQFKYDIHGDQRVLIDELGVQTLSTYDRMGRLTVRQELRNAATSADDFTIYYAYDGLGQQVKHWNSFHQTPVYGDPVWVEDPYYYDPYDPYYYYPPEPTGHWEYPIIGYTPDVQTTDYDIQGRVIATRAFGGDTTTTSYVWEAGMVTSGLGTFGGWSETTTMVNGRSSVEKTDLFGRLTWKSDLGGNVTGYTYDVAGRLSSSAMNGLTTGYTWLNAGFLGGLTIGSANAGQVNTNWTRDVASYTYDTVGNRLTETLTRETGVYTPEQMIWWNPYEPDWIPESYDVYSTLLKNQSATYDALGRMRTWAEAGTYTSPAATVANEYDAAGNVRRTLSSWRTLDANGTASASATTRDYWFRYDSMNRVVTNQGQLVGGVITRGAGYYGVSVGQDITYDVKGQRTSVTVTNSYYDQYYSYTSDSKELYFYDEGGRLTSTRQLEGTGATGSGTLRSAYTYDTLGRQTLQQDYNAGGTQVVFSRSASYSMKGQLLSDYSSNLKTDNKTYTSSNSYNYGAGTGYALGAVISQSTSNWVTGGSTTYSSTTNTYAWYDGAVQSTISYKPNTSQSTTYTTTFYYDAMGRLSSAYINDGKPHSVSFTNDELGQIIRRDESNISGQTGAPHEVWYRFSGRQLGYTGNNGTSDLSMTASIADRQVVSPSNQGTFRNKQMYGSSYADFAQSYDPINSFYQGSAGGSYTVQRGDTLQGIAQNLWGDASLWYKIAEANGLGAQTGLIEGQRLILPTGVTKNTHNAGTTRPYDPSEAIGDVSPSTSPKPKKAKCGVLGMILLAVVAVAVSIVTYGALTGPSTTLLGAIGAGVVSGAAGSIVSQAVGVATGIQEKFSFKAVALAALAGGVGAGLGQVGGAFGKFLNADTIVSNMAKAALGSVITQGIATATRLQSKFSFASVAYAAIGAGVSGAVAREGFGVKNGDFYHDIGGYSQQLVSGMAGGIAVAAAQTLIEGTNFGDNLLASLPSIVGGTIGTALGHKLAGTCFAAGTLIHTTRGLIKIEDIKVGDHVVSRDDDFERAENAANPVLELYRYSNKEVLEVVFAGGLKESVIVTPNHTFASAGNAWIQASDLSVGDRIWTINGSFVEVEEVRELEEAIDVFNFAVDNHHTYFVGTLGVWVHNQYRQEDPPGVEGKDWVRRNNGEIVRITATEAPPNPTVGGTANIPSGLRGNDERLSVAPREVTFGDGSTAFQVTMNNGSIRYRTFGFYFGGSNADSSVSADMATGQLSAQSEEYLAFAEKYAPPNTTIGGVPVGQVRSQTAANQASIAAAENAAREAAQRPATSITPEGGISGAADPVASNVSPATTVNSAAVSAVVATGRAFPTLQVEWISTTSPWNNRGGFTGPLSDRLTAGGVTVDQTIRPAPAGGTTRPSNWRTMNDRFGYLGRANASNGALAEQALRAERPFLAPPENFSNAAGARNPDLVGTRRNILAPWRDVEINVESKVGRTGNSGNAAVEAGKDIDRIAGRNAIRGRGFNISRGLGAAGVVLTGVELYNAYEADGGTIGVETKTVAAGAAGGLAGAYAGAQLGAAIGAFGGPVGILVGGVVGGLIGGFAGDHFARQGYRATLNGR